MVQYTDFMVYLFTIFDKCMRILNVKFIHRKYVSIFLKLCIEWHLARLYSMCITKKPVQSGKVSFDRNVAMVSIITGYLMIQILKWAEQGHNAKHKILSHNTKDSIHVT